MWKVELALRAQATVMVPSAQDGRSPTTIDTMVHQQGTRSAASFAASRTGHGAESDDGALNIRSRSHDARVKAQGLRLKGTRSPFLVPISQVRELERACIPAGRVTELARKSGQSSRPGAGAARKGSCSRAGRMQVYRRAPLLVPERARVRGDRRCGGFSVSRRALSPVITTAYWAERTDTSEG